MPLGPGVKYRVKTYPSGKKVRLAFRGNRVIEVKDSRGIVHTVADHMKQGRLKRRTTK